MTRVTLSSPSADPIAGVYGPVGVGEAHGEVVDPVRHCDDGGAGRLSGVVREGDAHRVLRRRRRSG